MAFEPFNYGNVLAQGENILAAREARNPNAPKNRLAQLQVEGAESEQAAAQDKAKKMKLYEGLSLMAQSPQRIPEITNQLKAQGLINSEFNVGIKPLEQLAADAGKQAAIYAQALGIKQPEQYTLGQGQSRFDASGNKIASGGEKPDTGRLYPVQNPDGSVSYQDRGSAVGQKSPPRTPLVQVGGGTSAPWSHLPAAQQGKAAERFAVIADKRLEAKREAIAAAAKMQADLDEFGAINANTETGPISGSSVVAGVRKLLPGGADLRRLETISSKLTPQMRQGMPGAASDRDVAMFRSATVSAENDYEVNERIISAARISLQGLQEEADAYEAYITENGHDRGFAQEWSKYKNENSIFDHTAPKGSYELNPNRKSWQQWRGSSSGGVTIMVYDPNTGEFVEESQ